MLFITKCCQTVTLILTIHKFPLSTIDNTGNFKMYPKNCTLYNHSNIYYKASSVAFDQGVVNSKEFKRALVRT